MHSDRKENDCTKMKERNTEQQELGEEKKRKSARKKRRIE
jgi:hypothetical protein